MELEVSSKGTVTSLQVLDEINMWRAKETELTGKRRAKLQHKTLLEIIRDEFEYEINEQKLLLVKYKDKKGELRPMFKLTLKQAKQVLLRESKFVRRSIISYIEKLENIIKEKTSTEWLQTRKNGKITRRKETDVIQTKLIPLAIEQGSKNYSLFYSSYTKLINKSVELEAGMRSECTREALLYVEFLESLVENVIIEESGKGTYYKDIYQICKSKIKEIKNIKKSPKQKYLEYLN